MASAVLVDADVAFLFLPFPPSFSLERLRVWDIPMIKNLRVWQHRMCLLFCKPYGMTSRGFLQVYIHLLCLLFSVLHNSKRHFPNGNRRQPPPCLPKSETDERKSMAAQPFIPTIDGVTRTATPTASPLTAQGTQQPVMVKRIGKTTYRVKLHFSETSKETMTDKIKRLILNDCAKEFEQSEKIS